jgi:Cd(II)/Pb(II)-responsive transcriptional regulator
VKRKIKIGELALLAHCRVETIRFYEKEGMLPPPPRSAGNYRMYDLVHIERLHFIRHCRFLDMTLEEIRQLLLIRDTPQGDCTEVNTFLSGHLGRIDKRIAELEHLRGQIRTLSQRCRGALTADQCGILQELGTQESTSEQKS